MERFPTCGTARRVGGRASTPPTEIAGFIYPLEEVHILTPNSVAHLMERTKMAVSTTLGRIPRLNSWDFSLNSCKYG